MLGQAYSRNRGPPELLLVKAGHSSGTEISAGHFGVWSSLLFSFVSVDTIIISAQRRINLIVAESTPVSVLHTSKHYFNEEQLILIIHAHCCKR